MSGSGGWESSTITDSFLASALKVRDGVAEFEQDRNVGGKIIYSPTILAFLVLALARQKDVLSIIDFGGALGSNYFQNRKILRQMSVTSIHWNVVERPVFAKLGREHFQTAELNFYESLRDVLSKVTPVPDGLLFSGSLQCIASPLSVLGQVIDAGVKIIAIDRLLVSPEHEHAVFIQHVPPKISFPVTCFSRDALIAWFIAKGFTLVEHFTQVPDAHFDICGMIFVRH